ncbi:MAG TPA: hypothetical protein VKQ72_10600, partial [Aggregatilineales bacterium]|nr:hypothetical protein [Aggregatilineales bacterium]
AQGRRVWITLGVAALIGLIGFLPYVYLPARALAHADWVYGDPSTLPGFLEQFTGKEASFLIHLPPDLSGWANDFVDSLRLLLLEWTPLLVVAGAASLAWAAVRSRFRREARIAALSIVGYFAFLFAFHNVVIPEADLLPIVMMFAFGIALALDSIPLTPSPSPSNWARGEKIPLVPRPPAGEGFRVRESSAPHPQGGRDLGWGVSTILAVIIIVTLVGANRESVYALTHDDSGLQVIARAKEVPRDGASVLMLPWGPHYTAVAYSKLVSQENADLPLVTHSADFRTLVAQGNAIYTERDTFYRFGLNWWDAQIGRAYLSSVGDSLVVIRQSPLTQDSAGAQPVGHGVVLHNASLCATDTQYRLNIAWGADSTPDAALSVFVKLLAGDAVLQPQGDSSAPVYGQYPTTRWTPGEVVYDTYEMPRLPGATALTFGMYTQEPSGKFDNFGVTRIPLTGVFSCSGGLAGNSGGAG